MEHAPLVSALAQSPDGGAAYWLTAQDGIRIRAGVWPAQGDVPKGTIFIFTGRSEFVEKYAWTISDLRRAGYAVVTQDWRGQGLADRLLADPDLGHVGRYHDYQHDVAAQIDMAQRLDLPQPWFLIGHSMGGGIGLRTLIERTHFKSAAFSGPMWGITASAAVERISRPLLAGLELFGRGNKLMLGQTTDTYVLSGAFEGNTLTTSEEGWEFIKALVTAEPRLGLGGPTAHWVREAVRETDELALAPLPAAPVYVGMGALDQITRIDAAQHNVDRWPGSELQIFDGAQHELMIERPEVRSAFLAKVLAHFERAVVAEAEPA